ncbi:response regulator [Shimia marina]|uniref:Protease production enhancer protein n=1 Tax=Shimia marina TaxID=321267 RepID=A0A0P1EUI3_9RHOB|nr:response regulator transcription factor [Shimia marina]CUH54145.1 Protease production enhancer protein [Shimia marina]SFD96587.1 two component transcriptional regulator, LuxR family [Shimia marina]
MATVHASLPPNRFTSALVVDDHPLFCDALVMTLQAVSPITEIATAPCLAEALTALETKATPDVVVLDLNLPDVNGFDGLIRLRKATPAKILVVSSMADSRTINAALQAGAAGFVPKHSQRDMFRRALDTLASGATFLPEGHMPTPDTEDATQDAVARLTSLTAQQARILDLICEGKLNKQIAFELTIAETTVKAHVTAIMRKLGVHSRTQAVLIAKEASFEEHLRSNG